MKKYLLLVILGGIIFSLIGCSSPTAGSSTESDVNLESVNEFLNNSGDLGPGSIANKVSIIPFQHIDGPKNESDFYAFVNFEYKARDYIKYQVTYLSCTCRSAAENYWQTAYVELSLPNTNNPDDVVIKYLSYDQDPSEHYLGGFWGDSSPTPAGVTYDIFKDQYIDYFQGKESSYIQTLSTMWDIETSDYTLGEGRSDLTIDTFTGSSVSANNIIRIINSLLDYHSQNEFFHE
ncbi:hypothetical protein GC105_11895 [Alkalibaculum sp. M08DMB]|uniref:Uncharacterized protein n=1 Tax=Alkalibaculum sporogenes TaxID=2655001 RepID=A0A6A7KBV6_9FIRM|nr:hypothetical protein [Alkalibaculum sporogenes]MPW26493.1 hypothetical protein [Alkalibaculum sporogenes]